MHPPPENLRYKANFDRLKERLIVIKKIKQLGGDSLSPVSISSILLQNTRDWVIYKEQSLYGSTSAFTHCQRGEDHQV